MDNMIFKTTLKNQGHYECRLLPNINDFNSPIITFKSGMGRMGFMKNYISYALINGEIKVWVFGNVVMQKIKDKRHPQEYMKFWNVSENKYLDINTSDHSGYVKVDIEEKEDIKYNFNEKREYIEKLINFIKHINLTDVLYEELFKRAEWEFTMYDDKKVIMGDVYKGQFDDFEEKYKVWLRSKKIKQIIG